MKRLLSLFALLALSTSALAIDVVTSMVVKFNGAPVYSISNTFHGVTDEQAQALQKSGIKQLDFAARKQGSESCKTCPYSIEWTWADQPTIVTERMTFGGVNATLRQGVKWLDDRVTAAEGNRQRGKAKPWGN